MAPMSVIEPWDLPDFPFDKELSEDENFLAWAQALARFSVSRKGHMGAILVRPHQQDDEVPSNCMRPLPPADAGKRFTPGAIRERVVVYANNTPLLFNSSPKQVQEIHAEALCISRAARLGRCTAGCTIYITFPPCNECFKSIVAAGIKRCVYRKNIRYPSGEAVLATAAVHGIEMCGTSEQQRPGVSDEQYLVSLSQEKAADGKRDEQTKEFWDSIGETTVVTRNRVNGWWTNFMTSNKAAVRNLQAHFGTSAARRPQKKSLLATGTLGPNRNSTGKDDRHEPSNQADAQISLNTKEQDTAGAACEDDDDDAYMNAVGEAQGKGKRASEEGLLPSTKRPKET
ncbi:hypothetical protein K437DRAFT_259369 [Tilletiaria anomala UBC 951]|uniref:CMP/dCMP-type deaminase domain-containing protein n=1 Tax=Tilletiaria anomala (strain ATCC 24038 / CBS 436.72 / UBC 951) TaxID=1037660 RepID=A0A066V9T9_TILAU|nr:uncharacterized protein K437DRAFT_259369 [Tilletiaria anomala UBC 951]KDN38507.1 hypothetical protein K437DRAFT_259369 [Tilletiaria anomala UBC 951]